MKRKSGKEIIEQHQRKSDKARGIVATVDTDQTEALQKADEIFQKEIVPIVEKVKGRWNEYSPRDELGQEIERICDAYYNKFGKDPSPDYVGMKLSEMVGVSVKLHGYKGDNQIYLKYKNKKINWRNFQRRIRKIKDSR